MKITPVTVEQIATSGLSHFDLIQMSEESRDRDFTTEKAGVYRLLAGTEVDRDYSDDIDVEGPSEVFVAATDIFVTQYAWEGDAQDALITADRSKAIRDALERHEFIVEMLDETLRDTDHDEARADRATHAAHADHLRNLLRTASAEMLPGRV